MSNRTALIDADVLAYRFGYHGTEVYEFGDDIIEYTDKHEAVRACDEHIEDIMDNAHCNRLTICLSDPEDGNCWRNEVMPLYKWNRDPSTRPDLYYAVRQHLEEKYDAWWRPGLEADDIMGILQTHPNQRNETVIVTVDKDLKQVPGRHYDPVKKIRFQTDEHFGRWFHMVQTLAGDPTDGYDGIPGIGMKKAVKILAPAEEDPVCMWELVERAFIEAGQWDSDYALEVAWTNACVAKMLQFEDWDSKRRRPILWTPPSHD